MSHNKLVFPGDHLSSAEEAEAGENSHIDGDEVYSSAVGENTTTGGKAAVASKGRSIILPRIGMYVYALVIKSSPNKAVCTCIGADEAEKGGNGMEFDAVLPVTAVRSGYVEDLRDEVKIGDIIKAKIEKVQKTGFDIGIIDHACGVLCAFCPKCRHRMDLKEKIFVCNGCGWKERRKLPLAEGEAPPPQQSRGYDRPRFGERSGGYQRSGYSTSRSGTPRDSSHSGYSGNRSNSGYSSRPRRY